VHQITKKISKNHAVVFLEDLKITNMSKSAKGSIESPGKNVKEKSGLNKSILEQGWGIFCNQLTYKLKWLGGWCVTSTLNIRAKNVPNVYVSTHTIGKLSPSFNVQAVTMRIMRIMLER